MACKFNKLPTSPGPSFLMKENTFMCKVSIGRSVKKIERNNCSVSWLFSSESGQSKQSPLQSKRKDRRQTLKFLINKS